MQFQPLARQAGHSLPEKNGCPQGNLIGTRENGLPECRFNLNRVLHDWNIPDQRWENGIYQRWHGVKKLRLLHCDECDPPVS